jgi:glutamate-5-semialdehyde dehydrogenase
MTLTEQMGKLARRAKAASRELAKLSTAEKNAGLLAMAEALEKDGDRIKKANAIDMAAGSQSGLAEAMLERLYLDEMRIASMAKGLREVAALPDPVGRILDERIRPNGLKLQKAATPIGVVVIIYESRPNVTADAAGLCFKSGNATILRHRAHQPFRLRALGQHRDQERSQGQTVSRRSRFRGGGRCDLQPASRLSALGD